MQVLGTILQIFLPITYKNFVYILKICKMYIKYCRKIVDILKITLHFQSKFWFLKLKSENI